MPTPNRSKDIKICIYLLSEFESVFEDVENNATELALRCEITIDYEHQQLRGKGEQDINNGRWVMSGG